MTPLKRALTIGSDPEFFVCDKVTGKPGSCIGLIGGTKDKPRPVERGAVQEDNVLAELNITPATTEDEFVGNLVAVRTTLDLLLPDGLYTRVIPSHEYTEEELASFGEKAREFGCEEDLNAYTLAANTPPNAAALLRTAGGHIHVGYNEPNPFDSSDIVRAMDLFLGVPSVLMDRDRRRRSMYGASGCFRMKGYGLEYRTLSNFWLGSEDLMRWAYRNTVRAVESVLGDENVVDEEARTTMGIPWSHIQEVINNSDTASARKLIKLYDLEEEAPCN